MLTSAPALTRSWKISTSRLATAFRITGFPLPSLPLGVFSGFQEDAYNFGLAIGDRHVQEWASAAVGCAAVEKLLNGVDIAGCNCRAYCCRGSLPPHGVSPAQGCAVNGYSATVVPPDADRHELLGGRGAFAIVIAAPAHDKTVNSNRTTVVGAEAKRGECPARRRLAGRTLARAPALDRSVDGESARIAISGADCREFAIGRRALTVIFTAPTDDCVIYGQRAGMFVPHADGSKIAVSRRRLAIVVFGPSIKYCRCWKPRRCGPCRH